MTSLLLRNIRSATVRPLLRLVNSRATPALLFRGMSDGKKERTIATPEEMATGIEKLEYDAIKAGIDDPFRLKMETGPPGTREEPTVVPSMSEERIVGCVCDEDVTYIKWFLLKAGAPQRCDCGHFFVLKKGNPINIEL